MSKLGKLLGVRAAVTTPPPAGNDRAPKGGSSSVWYSTPGQPQIPEWDGLTAIRSGYMASIYIMQPVRIIATALGSLPFRVGVDPEKPGDYDVNASMAKLLGPPPHGPNPVTSPRNLWIWTLAQRLITGRAAWETVCAPGSDAPAALWPLVAPFLLPIPSQPGTARWFDGYRYQLPTGNIDYNLNQVFYSWRPSQTDWRQPESALQAANMPASLQIALDRYMWALAKNGMAAKKLVITPEFAEDDERRAWEEQFASEFTGYDNGGRVMHGYYEDSADYSSTTGNRTPPIQVVDLASSPTDAQVLPLMAAVKDDMLRTWRVPMSWMGDSSQRTYENASQEAKNFWQGPVLELAAEMSDDVNQYLASRFGDGKVGWFDFSRVEALKGGSIFGAIDPVAGANAGLIKPDDWRNDVGLPPLDPADAQSIQPPPEPDDTPGGTSMTNFSRRDTATTFKPGRVDSGQVRDLLEHAYPGSVLDWVADAAWKYDPAAPLDEIKMARRPGGRDMTKVEGIAQAIRDGKPMDPVVLVDTGEGKLEIADGYHRTLAFDRAGRRTIPALIGSGAGQHGPWETAMHDAKLNRSVVAAGERYDTSPLGTGKNWVTETGGLDPFLRAIAHALVRNGHSESEAIQLAVGVAKRWASGGGKVTAKTRAKAARAVARWEAQKAAAHGPPNRDALVESGAAGLLLPTAPTAKLVAAAHAFQSQPAARRKCRVCGLGVTAKAHGLVKGVRHAGPDGHLHRPSGHAPSLTRLAKRTRRLIDSHAAEFEPKTADVMRGLFAKQAKATIDRLQGRRGQQMIRATQQPPDDGQPIEQPGNPDVARIFAFGHWVTQTEQALNPVFTALQTKTAQRLAADLHPGVPVFPDAVAAATRAAAGRVSQLADSVTRTTYSDIASALADGITAGDGISGLTARVQKVFDDASHSRAETIARTEVMSSINSTQNAYAQNLPPGVVASKQWLATPDNRTRETHREANGQRRPIREAFNVGGYPMQHPGDPTAPADEWVNCRCTTLYVPARMATPASPAAAAA